MPLLSLSVIIFQSTSLSRGKTFWRTQQYPYRESFNPLPSHEGRQPISFCIILGLPFNPLPSHEGRPHPSIPSLCHQSFQSTSLSRGKTLPGNLLLPVFSFNPLPSHEGRPFVALRCSASFIFQSTSLSRGKTAFFLLYNRISCLSIHFPLTREDNLPSLSHYPAQSLSIHFPLTREDIHAESERRGAYLSIHFPLTREDVE